MKRTKRCRCGEKIRKLGTFYNRPNVLFSTKTLTVTYCARCDRQPEVWDQDDLALPYPDDDAVKEICEPRRED